MANKTSIVLVHGAWGDGSCWGRIITLLKKEGHNVSATQHPLTSLSDDVEVTRRLVELQQGPVILVGHSYGGAIITEAAGKCPNVTGLVYIAAFAPDAGENLGGLSQLAEAPAGNTAIRPDKYGSLWLDKEKFAESFCQDIDKTQSDIMATVQKPIAVRCFEDKVMDPGWKKLPSWYQLSTNDRMISPALEKIMSERIKPKDTLSLPAGHASMVSFPKEVADLILKAAKNI